MEYFYEDLEKVDKGIHHIMEISGVLMQNQGHEISPHISQTLLPVFAQVLLNISDKKDYELVDSVCFICDVLEHGTPALFNQVKGQACTKFVQLVHYGTKNKEDINYDLVQSCVFALGVTAQKSEHGQFDQLKDTLLILGETCKTDIPAGIDEEEKESRLNLADNSISALFKIVIF